MSRPVDNLEVIAEQIRQTFSRRDAAREKALPLAREVIRHSSTAIRAIHRQEFDRAVESLGNARRILGQIKQDPTVTGELFNTSFVRDAEKEYAEGQTTLAMVTGSLLLGPDELEVDAAAYLNGLGEAAGELRRYLLDSIRHGDLSRGEELLEAMDSIYGVLVTMDFPDAITSGLRRTTDMVRGVLERTRSDLTLVIRQKELEEKISKVK
ncbi:MAG: haloacid dehalogenase [Dehalococcoidales bacterium]|jgi:translin